MIDNGVYGSDKTVLVIIRNGGVIVDLLVS